jgi:ABC-type phosphate transport system auxiliary subunit
MSTTDIEKKSLEAHVELCAERYENLEHKLNSLSTRMDKMELYLMDIRNTLISSKSAPFKTMIAIGTTVVGVLIAGLISVIINLVK